jgi:hypothetical protein
MGQLVLLGIRIKFINVSRDIYRACMFVCVCGGGRSAQGWN